MTFGAPQWLWGLFLIPLLIALFIRSERRGLKRLQEFVSARLLPQLAGTVNRPRRILRFALQLLGLALAIVSLAQPRWGYTFEDVKRKGLDLLIAVDTSRSMLSNDVQPTRLDRVKLAIQDLISQLQGDRVGLIAFAGRAFLQAPLTIDYDAVVEAVNDLDTKTIPEGGTNISSAITLATQSFGKSAVGNRALVIFTDGEELSGDAVKTAKEAVDAGVRIFTVGVGTPQGSLIPVTGDDGQTSFVKDSSGEVVKSKLDDKRLREIAQATGGFYLHLENGLRTMQQIQNEGLAKMQAAEMDVRLSRRPVERYEWPLAAALIALALSILIPERKRVRQRAYAAAPVPARRATRGIADAPAGAATAVALLAMFLSSSAFATAPGLDAYRGGKFEDAYSQFQEALKSHPQSRAEDKLQFDSGAAAYKLKDYSKALESFSQALLSEETALQSKGHYNLGNTLYQRGEAQKSDDKKLSDWTNALDHYEQTLKLDPQNKEAKDNYDYVKRKIEELKNKKQEQPSPSPSPQQKNEQNKQDKQNKQNKQNKQDQQQKQQQQNQQQQQGQGEQQQKDQQQSQDQQSQGKSGNQKDQQQEKKDQSQAKNEPQKKQQQPGETPSPSPSADKQQGQQPSPSPGERRGEESPSPGEGENETPSPSPGEGEGESTTPSATPGKSPQKKFAGDVKGAGEDKSQKPPDKNAQVAEAEPEKEGQMSERQAEALLESMKDEEARVQLDERRATRHVYKDW
ncbi:MAG TPA: VWA domain-containing protein [Candidatus Dormibacteraeota bacterium]|nr:VWA domain-containing protein [Candidatus Dormibacteraeota bacterium]